VSGKFVYVLSSSQSDYFAEMTAVSLASLRLTNPTAKATLIIDSESKKNKYNAISHLLDNFDELIDVEIDHNDQIYFSRYMKVNSRKFISGDFLYIDSDAIVLRDLSSIWSSSHDVRGALDMSSANVSTDIPESQVENYRRMKWDKRDISYINCGVFYMKDNIRTHELQKKWFDEWARFSKVIGKFNDQPSFNYSLEQSDVSFSYLPQLWNAQIVSNPLDARDAKIAHIFSGNFETRQDTVLHTASQKFKAEGVIDIEILKKAIQNGHAWVSLDTFKKNLAMRRYAAAANFALRKLIKK
jgi:hypothetical protein